MEFEEFKDSGVEWIGKVPKHWRCEHLKRVCLRIQTGTTPPTENIEYYDDGTIPWFSPGSYNGGIYLEEPAKLINEVAQRDNKIRMFPAQSIFFVGIGATIGKVAMTRVEASCNQQITGIVCNFESLPKYMTYQFKIYEGIIPQISKYTTLPIMDQVKISYLRVAIPPLAEQRRIAAYLDKTCAAIDNAIEKKQKQLETLDELHKARLHVTFAHNEWPMERIKDIANKIGSGVTPEGGASNYLDDGIPLLRSQNVHFDGLRLDDVAFISEETHTEMAGSQLKSRDVLLNITGASIGRCTFVPEDFGEGNVNQHVCIIRGNHKIDYRFLVAFLASPMGQGQILSSFTGASRQGLSHKELGFIRIPLPSLDEQRKIVVALEEQKLRQNQVRANIESQIETLIAYRKSLIYECVTGKRRITEDDIQQVQQY